MFLIRARTILKPFFCFFHFSLLSFVHWPYTFRFPKMVVERAITTVSFSQSLIYEVQENDKKL